MNGPDNLIESPLQGPPVPEVQNHTKFPSQYFQMFDVEDQAFHVIVTRMTYDLNSLDEQGTPRLAEIQTPLVEADLFYGEPNKSSIIQESDFAPYKPQCDVLFCQTTAYSPDGKAAKQWPIGVRIGEREKRLTVTGPRQMTHGVLGWSVTDPAPVTEVPIRFDAAFGGTCQWPDNVDDPEKLEVDERFAENPIGCGFVHPKWLKKAHPSHLPAPQIERFDRPFTARDASEMNYPAIGLGPIGRWWQGRLELAGTYDDEWKKTRWPRLPLDFDFAYWNCAPKDQQIPYPTGGEEMVAVGLLPAGRLAWRLPKPQPKILLHVAAGVPMFKLPNVDTIIVDLRAMQLILVQRTVISAQAEVEGIEIGTWDIEAARAANAARLRETKAEGK